LLVSSIIISGSLYCLSIYSGFRSPWGRLPALRPLKLQLTLANLWIQSDDYVLAIAFFINNVWGHHVYLGNESTCVLCTTMLLLQFLLLQSALMLWKVIQLNPAMLFSLGWFLLHYRWSLTGYSWR
jgi:hypothetical protein